MAGYASRSSVFANSRIEVIPYGIDTETFRAIPQQAARAHLVLPDQNFLLLFGVDNAREKRKGLRELFAALEGCGKNEEFKRLAAERKPSLLCFGELGDAPKLPIPIRQFGRVRSDELLCNLYSAADLFLLPSLEDNLPNTALEAMSCGTPVGAFSSGGIPEMIIPGETGFLASTGMVNDLVQIVVKGAQNLQRLREMRPSCRRHIETRFSYRNHAQACVALYEGLVRAPRKSAKNNTVHRPAISLNGHKESEFARGYAAVLKHVFDLNPQVTLAPIASSSPESEKLRRDRFARRVKRILKHAVNKRWSNGKLTEALDSEFTISNGVKPWPLRQKVWLRRFLGRQPLTH
jgi:hypothetical protein